MMELPNPAAYAKLSDALRSGLVAETDINEAVAHVLTAKFRVGLFEHPYVDPDRAKAVVGSKEHAKLARKVADESIVLLQNKNSTLPLNMSHIKTIAVIGPNADKVRLGGYSGIPPYYVTVLDGIRRRVGSETKVAYAEGCRISEPDKGPNLNSMAPYKAPNEQTDQELIAEAIDTAKSADVVVLALGGNEVVSRESLGEVGMGKPAYGDSDTLDLPGRQNELAAEIAKLGKPVVAVLLNGRAYSIGDLTKEAAAIVEGWYLGQETRNAIAGVLFGDVNPSGPCRSPSHAMSGSFLSFFTRLRQRAADMFSTKTRPCFPLDSDSVTPHSLSESRRSIVSGFQRMVWRRCQLLSATPDLAPAMRWCRCTFITR